MLCIGRRGSEGMKRGARHREARAQHHRSVDESDVAALLRRIHLEAPSMCRQAEGMLRIFSPPRPRLAFAVSDCRSGRQREWMMIERCSTSPSAWHGKSFVACALAPHACRRGFAYYRRASRLFDDLTLAWSTAATVDCSASSPAWTSASSMTGAWRRQDQERRDVLEISRTATATARRSSRANCPWPVA